MTLHLLDLFNPIFFHFFLDSAKRVLYFRINSDQIFPKGGGLNAVSENYYHENY